MLTREQFLKFFALDCALSPENLHCDGEISVAEANRKYRRLMKEWRTLEAEVGVKVASDELWSAQYATFRRG